MSTRTDMSAQLDGASSPDDLTRPLYGATVTQALQRFFRRFAMFHGRSSRSEFWWVQLVLLIVSIAFAVATVPTYTRLADQGITDVSAVWSALPGWLLALMIIWSLLILVPSLALAWRRLHDANFTGLLWLLSAIPGVGSLIVFVLHLLPSRVEGRRFDR